MFTSVVAFSSAWCSQYICFLFLAETFDWNIPYFFFNEIAEICLYYEMLKTREHCYF